MKIKEVQSNIEFGNRKYPSVLTKNISILKNKMETETINVQRWQNDTNIKVRALGIDGYAIFRDGKYFVKRTPENVLIPYGNGTTLLEFGKVKLVSDANGKIIEHEKPFYKTWNKVFNQAQYYISRAITNYDNPSIITKQLYRGQKFQPASKQLFNIIKILIKMNPWNKKF